MTGAQAINREIVDLTIMSGRKDEPDGPAARTFRFQIPQRETTVQGIGPLTPLDHQGGSVKPIADKRLARRLRSAACALRGLVLVMRENQILAPQMQVETGNQNGHAHGPAFDIPPGLPSPQVLSPRISPFSGARAFHREKSAGSPFSYSSTITRRPGRRASKSRFVNLP